MRQDLGRRHAPLGRVLGENLQEARHARVADLARSGGQIRKRLRSHAQQRLHRLLGAAAELARRSGGDRGARRVLEQLLERLHLEGEDEGGLRFDQQVARARLFAFETHVHVARGVLARGLQLLAECAPGLDLGGGLALQAQAHVSDEGTHDHRDLPAPGEDPLAQLARGQRRGDLEQTRLQRGRVRHLEDDLGCLGALHRSAEDGGRRVRLGANVPGILDAQRALRGGVELPAAGADGLKRQTAGVEQDQRTRIARAELRDVRVERGRVDRVGLGQDVPQVLAQEARDQERSCASQQREAAEDPPSGGCRRAVCARLG